MNTTEHSKHIDWTIKTGALKHERICHEKTENDSFKEHYLQIDYNKHNKKEGETSRFHHRLKYADSTCKASTPCRIQTNDFALASETDKN